LYCLIAGSAIVSAALFAGCKSGTAPTAAPAPAPVTKEAPKTPALTDAQDILRQATENSLNVKSVSSEMQMDVEMMGMKLSFVFDISKSGDITYSSGEVMGMCFETYSDGKNVVMLDPMTGKWTRLPPDQEEVMMSLEQIQRKVYGEHIQNAVLAGEEKILDKPCHIIEASVKAEAFNEILSKQNNPMLQGMDIKFSNASLKMWVEKDTFFVSRAALNMEATLSGDIPGMPGTDIEDEETPADPKAPPGKPEEPKTAKIKYEIEVTNSDYNKVAPIEIPPEAKALLETPPAPVNK
jgi:outer membrane lipoprotein-sorting protein